MAVAPRSRTPIATAAERAAPAHATRGGTRLPVVVLGLGLGLIALAVLSVNVRITGYLLDETLIKQSAVHYSEGLPGTLFNDVTARATSRLYSLLVMPLFATLHGDEAVRAARGVNALIFAGAGVPAFLLAVQVLRSRWLAVAAALLCVALPWLTLSTAMFTESLAYMLVLWTAVAMLAAYRRPAWWRDGLVLVAIGLATCTRTQLIALAGAYAVTIAARLWADRPARGSSQWSLWATHAVKRYACSAIAGAGLVVAVARLAADGRLADETRALLGTYAVTTSDQTTLPADVGLSLSAELLAIALGLGVVPALLGLAWYPSALRRSLARAPGAHAYAVVSAALVLVLFAATLYAQGRYLQEATEERYYFYGAPFLLIAGYAALESRLPTRRAILEVCAGLTVIALILPLPRSLATGESSFFAPAFAGTGYVLGELLEAFASAVGRAGLSARDALALIVVALGILTAVLWRSAPRRGPAVAMGIAAAIQLGLTILAFASIDGRVAGTPGRTGDGFAQLGFIDRATADQPVTWVDNQPRSEEAAADAVQRTAGMYNDAIRARVAVTELATLTPDNFPLNALPLVTATVAPSGALAGATPLPTGTDLLVATADSPFLQLAGSSIGRSRPADRLEVIRAGRPLRARWLATGLAVDGGVEPNTVARLRSWGRSAVRMRLQAAAPVRATVRLGDGVRSVDVTPAGTAVDLLACGPATGRLRATGRVVVAAVELSPVGGRCAA